MYCLDWNQDIKIFGSEKDQKYQRLEIVMVPCNYVHSYLGYDKDTVTDGCIADLDKQIEYLGPLDFMLYHTEEIFKPDEYGERQIVR